MRIRGSGVANQIRSLFDGGTAAGLTDGELLERFAARRGGESEVAFAALLARHGPMVLGVCRGLLRDAHDAEDAFQATFLVLALKARTVRQPELLGPWLHGVAHRTATRLRDKDARRRRHEAEAAMSGARPAGVAVGHEPGCTTRDEVEALHEEIDRLPERYRAAIVLCDLQGLTHEEAARRLGRPVSTISTRLSRGRERLKGRLSRRGLALPAGVATATLIAEGASAMPPALVDATLKVAMSASAGLAAGTVPASIAIVTRGVLRSMLFTRRRMMAAAALAAGTLATGMVVLAHQGPSPRPAPGPDGPATRSAAPPLAPAEAGEGEEPPREAERIVRSATNLARIATAIHAYAEPRDWTFPTQAIVGADGKPLLSWRVAILPYIGEKALFARFKLDEPWDGPHNKALLEKMPRFYLPLDPKAGEKGATYYQVFVGGGSLFEVSDKVTISGVKDGTVNTLMVVEAATTVPWTKPEDLVYAPDRPLPKLGGQFKDGFAAATADGAIHFLARSTDPMILNALITRDGGEVVGNDTLGESIQVPRNER